MTISSDLLNMTPGVEIGGPLIKDKLNFSETMTYEFRKDPVHGLTWPRNETVTYSLVSFTAFQYTFSSKHVLNVNFNVFPATVLYANINALIPQTASTNIRRRGSFQPEFPTPTSSDSGAVLTTLVRYTNFYNSDHGHGLADMTNNPEGWGGNYFNTFSRNGNQVEALPILQMPVLSWLGTHQVQFGADILYRSFTGSSVSRPIELLAQDGTIDETINFLGQGILRSSDGRNFRVRGGSLVVRETPRVDAGREGNASRARPERRIRAATRSRVFNSKRKN